MDRENTRQKAPQEGELVIGTVSKVFPYGAFVKLDEYAGAEGLIHVSEIASKWIKNIKDYVEEGQKVVVKVLKVQDKKIDLSLKSVKGMQKKKKLDEYKRENKALKLLEMAADRIKDKDGLPSVRNELENSFDSVYSALEAAVKDGEGVFSDLNISPKWKKALDEIAKERIEIPTVSIKAVLELETKASNGAEIIRDSMVSALENNKEKDVETSIKYISAPKYKIEIVAPEYKAAEKVLEGISTSVIKDIETSGGSGKLTRE